MTKFYLPTSKVAAFVALFSLLIGGFTFGDEDFYLKEANMHIRGLSGFVPFGTVQYHSLLFEASECDNELTNGCIADLQSFTQKWYDLDLFFVDNKGNVGHHTIMDRNMGASEVYNKKFGLGNVNTGSFGYRYQWGNNYGFKPCYTNGCSDFLEGTGEVTSYHVRDYVYNEGEGYWQNPLPYFAQNVWNDGYAVYDSQVEAIMREENDPPSSIRHQQGQNLRGGVGDTYDGQGNYGEGNGTIVYNNTTRNHSRKGPCPSGYHVPSAKEWDEIFLGWGYAKNKQIDIGGYYGSSIYGTNEGKNFASDLLLPPAGHRKANSLEGRQQGIFGDYRSSSSYENVEAPTYFSSSFVARIFEISSDAISENSREVSSTSQEGLSVRCIKDSPDSELNIYPNGGTNAFISIYKGKIIALGSPKRAGYTFEGWYTNEDFTGEKVEVGESIGWRIEQIGLGGTSIPHLDLYAKRKANPKCTDLPSNATANNSNTPTIDTKYYYSTNTSLTCTFQCNPNYTWNSTTSKCVPNGCQGTLPDNATLWNPSIVPSDNTTSYSYSATSTTEACKFKCNTNYTWNSSTSSCVNNTPTTYQCIGTLPANSTRNNNITPDKNTNYYYSTDISLACTFHCNTNYTWNSSTSSCQITPQTYTLTINYKYSDGSTASATVTKTLTGGASYSVSSPIISNYTASTSVVKGTMPYSDKTIDVVYTKIGSSGGGGGGSSSSRTNRTLKISASPSSPDTYEWIKLTVETDDDYTNKIYFSEVQYKSNSSSSWSTISRTSSTYVSDYSSDWSNGYYKMTSSDDGYVNLKNLVKFKKGGYYKIYIEDTDGNEDYIQIYVYDYNGNSSNTLEISASPSNPDTYEWVKLNITTDDDYVGKISFSKFQYRSSTSSSWSSISRTSSTYVSDYSSTWSNGYYKMTSSDDGEATLKNLIKFKKSGYYRIYVEDTDGNESYVQINVDEDNESSSNKNSDDSDLSLSVNNEYPNTYDPISLTIKTNNYVGKIKLYAKLKDSSSNRTKITNTSSTYFENYSNSWENGYYKMTSSDKGKKTLYDLIEIKKTGTYRIYAEDEEGYLNYVTININTPATVYNDPITSNNSKTNSGYDIDRMISELLGTSSSSTSNSTNSNNQTNDDIERNKNNLSNVSDEIYKSRSCKEYRIKYDPNLGAFTSPNLQKSEYFVNKEYFKRYIDSKNPRKEGCPTNEGWISTSYKDSSTSDSHFVAPNGKVYSISSKEGKYYSNNLTTNKSFATLVEIKNFIKSRNPLIGMETKK